MRYAKFQQHLTAMGMSGREFARLMKLNPNTIPNYKAVGSVPSHLAVIAVLLRTLVEHDIDYRPVMASVPIRRNAPRGKKIGVRKRRRASA